MFHEFRFSALLLFGFLSILLCCSSQKQGRLPVTTIFPKEDLIADLDQLYQTILNQHPHPFRFTSQGSWDSLILNKKEKISDNTMIGEFTWICREIMGKIGCGHSTVPTLGSRLSMDNSFQFPLSVKFFNDSLYVLDPLINDDTIKVGDIVLSINGHSVTDIQEEMKHHISADGFNASSISSFINYDFSHYLPYHLGFPNQYDIVYSRNGKVVENHLTLMDSLPPYKSIFEPCPGNLCFDKNEELNTAIITIRSFAFYGPNYPRFKKFVDDCFHTIMKDSLDKVILDIRDNQGGDPYCTSYLLKYLLDNPFDYFEDSSQGYNDIKSDILPHYNPFKGKLIVLINGKCFSSSGHFCSVLKRENRGEFIGEESGSTFTCNAAVQSFDLPKTGITFYLATGSYTVADVDFPLSTGIMPDITIKPALKDWIERKDTVLNSALFY